MSAAHTPGPWFSDRHGRIWRRDPAELYENGGGVAGDMPVAMAEVGWYGEGVRGYPMEANARLIAAAPTMYEYIASSASNGCAEAKKIVEAIHASR